MGRYIPDFAGTYRIFVLNTGTTTMRAGTYRAGNFGTGPGPCPVFRSNPVPGIPGFSNALVKIVQPTVKSVTTAVR